MTAHPDFLLVISYNPGYQSVLKDLKPSTRQRFVSIDFDYPDRERETTIIAHESGVDARTAERLAVIGEKTRHLRERGFEEGVSTRLLIYTAQLIVGGIDARRAAGHLDRPRRFGRSERAARGGGHRRRRTSLTSAPVTDPLLLVDVERRLGLFALAIAGHAYHVRADTEFKSTVDRSSHGTAAVRR